MSFPEIITPTTLRHPLGMAFRAFVFSTALCALSCYYAVSVSWTPHDGQNRELAFESGALRFSRWSGGQSVSGLSSNRWAERGGIYLSVRIPEPLAYHDTLLKAMCRIRREQISPGSSRVSVPLWPLTLLTLLPALRFARRKYHERVTRRRLRRGGCVACGYDLRASPNGCPECGHGFHDPLAAPAMVS